MNNVPSHNARPFLNIAAEIRRGLFLDECTDELQKVVAAVEETQKSGKLVIELTIAPASKGQGVVKVSDKIKAVMPAFPAGETIMFVSTDNNLLANDPRQHSLELKQVIPQEAALKTVTA